ncbi:MAG: hypothetical protein HY646_12845 [Acidobacteria bacterium]|nr:hypothetical protein [Acidobacteriota bacterium]
MLARIAAGFLSFLFLQLPVPPVPSSAPRRPIPPAEKLGENLFRIGNIRVDTANREISVPGTRNNVSVLEFIANTKGGFKAYESAISADTDAVTFNLALTLIGLDSANSVPSRRHFDPEVAKGDPVEIWVEWQLPPPGKRVRAEEIVYSKKRLQSLPQTIWAYTGSKFMEDGRYLADVDGVLIGFVHDPASIIEYPALDGVDSWGTFQINPNIGLLPGVRVNLIVKALTKEAKDK